MKLRQFRTVSLSSLLNFWGSDGISVLSFCAEPPLPLKRYEPLIRVNIDAPNDHMSLLLVICLRLLSHSGGVNAYEVWSVPMSKSEIIYPDSSIRMFDGLMS